MTRTLLMEALLGETRLAVIEDGCLCELYVERPGPDDAAGSIYLGRVENVISGMNAAFIDIGMAKNGFLYAGDISITDRSLSDKLGGLRIEKLARPGRDMLVQVVKAQSGQKGHRVSCHITLPGRNLVLLTDVEYAGVSRKIDDPAERGRLSGIARAMIAGTGMGVIVRTAAAGASEEVLRGEWERLISQWRELQNRAQHAVAPKRLFSNGALALKAARDMLDDAVDALWVDGETLYREVVDLAAALCPDHVDRIRLHDTKTPLFDLHRVDAQLDKALRKYVWLKSGGSLVIEETEAMTVVDVNTGKFTGKRDLEETIYKLNREAAEELVRQLRLRDIGGIVIVDFIDMASAEHNEGLLRYLRELAKTDRSRLNVLGMTGLGLVELTRKKERPPLSKQLMHTCSSCGGDGATPSHETTARRVARDIWRRRRAGEEGPILVTACGGVANGLKSLGNPCDAPVYVAVKEAMKPGEYDVSPADVSNLPEGAKMLKRGCTHEG